MSASTSPDLLTEARSVELVIGGMTCASCAARIEKKLNKLEGVVATVNYATEKAKVTYAGSVTPQDLVAIVEATGYSAALPAPKGRGATAATTDDAEQDEKDDEVSALRQRLVISAALSLPVLLLSAIPALQFKNWQWMALTLASPVVVWGALPVHRAAITNARRLTATMDTLISVGVGAAWLLSLWVLFFGGAARAGMPMSAGLQASTDGGADIYLGAAAVLTVFTLAGRYIEASPTKRSGAALRAQSGKAPVRRPADRVSGVFVPFVIILAVYTWVAWLVTGHSQTASFTAAVAVLIIACPCALGLASATALLVGTRRGAQLGILINGPQILESTRRVDTIVLDKTAIADTSAEAIAQFRKLGLRPILLTGDNAGAAHAVAAKVGIGPQDVIADVLPADKVSAVKALQDKGCIVAMVGDGVKDAAALAQADLGLAMGTGGDLAIEESDLTLVRGDLRAAADAIRLARSTLRTIKGNLFWAFAFNVAAIPLAASGQLNPTIVGTAMAFGSVVVVGNSLRLRRFRPLSKPAGSMAAVR